MGISVLVVDDYPLVREGLACALGADPALSVVGVASDGRRALDLARELRPDVILLDLFMPEMGGIVVLEHLRMSGVPSRALVLTASERPETLREAIDAGAAGYLTKRSSLEEVRQAVLSVHAGGIVIAPSMVPFLLDRAADGGARAAHAPLSVRERELLRLIAQGRTDREIGAELHISARTVQKCLGRIRDKTGLRRRSELASWVGEHARA